MLMSYQDEFDNIKNKLDRATRQPFDERLAWNQMGPQIQARLERKRRRRALIWWWLQSGLVLLMLLVCIGERKHRNISETRVLPPIASLWFEAVPNADHSTFSFVPKPLPIESNLSSMKTIAASPKNWPGWNPTPLLPGLSPKIQWTTIPYSRLEFGATPLLPSRNDLLGLPPYPWSPIGLRAPKPNETSGDWYISMGGGLNVFSENNPGQFPESTETPLPGWETNLRLQHRRPVGWTWQVGLAYRELRYRSNWEGTSNVQLYRPNTIDTVFINARTGDRTFTYRDSIPGTRTRIFQQYNSHRNLSLMLLGGYTWSNERVGVQIQTGPEVQLWRQASGKTVVAPNDIRDLNTIYHQEPILALRLETQFNYGFNDRWQILLRSAWSKSITNWSVQELDLDRRPSVWSLQIGLQYALE